MQKKFPSIPLAQIVVRICNHKKVKHIVLCPGSRNAPLTNGFVSDSYFKTYSIIDERAAGFFGLGIAQQTRQPAALVCTSGSALLNFYPAVAEAYYSNIPLIVLSADRMPHQIDIGDGQTIRQGNVLSLHLKGVGNLKPDISHSTLTLLKNPMQQLVRLESSSEEEIIRKQGKIQQHNIKEINKIINIAIYKNGPVHLNIPLEEPLGQMTEKPLPLKLRDEEIRDKNTVIDDFEYIRQRWTQSKKKMVLIGVLPPTTVYSKWIGKLIDDPSVVVLTETTSNIRHKEIINSIDNLMYPLELDDTDFQTILKPDILLTLGGMVVSKKTKAFLRNYRPEDHWHVDIKQGLNTYYCLKQHFKCDPNDFLAQLYSGQSEQVKSSYREQVMCQYRTYCKRGKQYLANIDFSDLKVFEVLLKNIPKKLHLQIANSSPIRYVQLFDLPKENEVFCNRGVGGIDGSTATAVGAAQIQKKQTLLITGDLSFFYDINGLWNGYIPNDFRIVLINNQGGGIFRILYEEKDTPNFDRYFETVHRRNAKYVSKDFGFKYQNVNSLQEVENVLSDFFSPSPKPKLLEITTPRKTNDRVLLNYFKSMTQNQ